MSNSNLEALAAEYGNALRIERYRLATYADAERDFEEAKRAHLDAMRVLVEAERSLRTAMNKEGIADV